MLITESVGQTKGQLLFQLELSSCQKILSLSLEIKNELANHLE